MKSTLQSKVAAALWVMTTLGTLTAALLSSSLLVNSHLESLRGQLQVSSASLLSVGISDFSELDDFGRLNNLVEDALQMERVDKIVRIYNHSLGLVFSTVRRDYDGLPDKITMLVDKPAFQTLRGSRRQYESLTIPFEGEKNKKRFYLQIAIPLPSYAQILSSLWWQSLLLFGFLIGTSMILSRWLAKRLTQPITEIANHLKTMDPHQVESWKPLPLPERSHYLSIIVDGINSLAERTRSAVLQIRKMGRYVAHELRTPLTVMQGEAETVLLREQASRDDFEKVIRSSLDELHRMSETVTTILKVGDRERTAALFHPCLVNLAAWLEENRCRWEKTLGKSLNMEIPIQGPWEALIDPSLLYHLMDNLIRNVRHHARTGAEIILQNDDGIDLIVRDEGKGLLPDQIDSLNGKGIDSELASVGLNLCFAIAGICRLKLFFLNRAEGGLEVRVRI